MESAAIADEVTVEAFDLIAEGISRLQASGLDRLADADVRAMVAAAEQAAHRLASVQVELLAAIDRRALYTVDGHANNGHANNGHANATVMIRHLPRVRPALAEFEEALVGLAKRCSFPTSSWRSGDGSVWPAVMVRSHTTRPIIAIAMYASSQTRISPGVLSGNSALCEALIYERCSTISSNPTGVRSRDSAGCRERQSMVDDGWSSTYG